MIHDDHHHKAAAVMIFFWWNKHHSKKKKKNYRISLNRISIHLTFFCQFSFNNNRIFFLFFGKFFWKPLGKKRSGWIDSDGGGLAHHLANHSIGQPGFGHFRFFRCEFHRIQNLNYRILQWKFIVSICKRPVWLWWWWFIQAPGYFNAMVKKNHSCEKPSFFSFQFTHTHNSLFLWRHM